MSDGILDKESIERLGEEASREIEAAGDLETLERARISWLGRKGKLTSVLRSIGSLPPETRPVVGGLINSWKEKLGELYESRCAALSGTCGDEEPYPGDPTLPGRRGWEGGLHVLHRVIRDIKEIFYRMGYSIAEGPDVELDYYNFEALNFPADHPSRDLQDTFYVNRDILLRTQTSPVQVRYMEKNAPPIRIISPGRVYRNETPDPSHASEFFQIEGLYVDKDVSLADLRNDITWFVQQFFGPDAKVRFRPHFFPFTEPSAEMDVSCVRCHGAGCASCKGSGWIEILGAGLIDPEVMKMVGYDPDEFTGYAFGMGVERLAMLRHGIDDLRIFFENDLRFLEQFK